MLQASTAYLEEVHKLQLGYSVLLLIQFLFVLVIITWLYSIVLRDIKAIAKHVGKALVKFNNYVAKVLLIMVVMGHWLCG